MCKSYVYEIIQKPKQRRARKVINKTGASQTNNFKNIFILTLLNKSNITVIGQLNITVIGQLLY